MAKIRKRTILTEAEARQLAHRDGIAVAIRLHHVMQEQGVDRLPTAEAVAQCYDLLPRPRDLSGKLEFEPGQVLKLVLTAIDAPPTRWTVAGVLLKDLKTALARLGPESPT